MKINKKILSIALGLLMSGTQVMAAPQFKYIEKEKSEMVAEGLEHKFITDFTSDGFRGINILKFNLADPNLKLVPIFGANGTQSGSAVSKMVANKGAVAGVNGDFFNYNPFFSLGLAIENGELISSNSDSSNPTPSIIIGKDNSLSLGRVEISMNLRVNDKVIPVGIVNKPNNYGSTGIYTRRYGTKTRGGKVNSQTEVAVKDGVVVDRQDQGGPMNIPENGFVANIKDGMPLPNVGDKVSFEVTGINLANVDFALGAGAQILKDGNVVKTGISIEGSHPRTAIGFNKNTLDCVILTVDGRSIYHGMSMTEVSEYLLSLGMTDGFNFDGGGSTTMAIRNVDSGGVDVVNYIESERAVANGVGIMSSSQVGAPAKIVVDTVNEKMFKGTSQTLTLKIYDEKGNPLKTDRNLLSMTSNLSSDIYGTKVKPLDSGDMTLTINYANLVATQNIKVLESPTALILPKETISLSKGEKYKIPSVIGIDGVGNRANIAPNELNITVTGNIGKVDGGAFIRNDKAENGAIVLKFGDAMNRIVVSKSASKTALNPLSKTDGLSANASPNGARASLQQIKDKQGNALRLWYNFESVKDAKTASVNFKNMVLPEDSAELSIFLGHVEDEKITATLSLNGEDFSVDFTKYQKVGDYNEWRAKLPGKNGIVLKSIAINEEEGKGAKGYIDMKYLAGVISPDTSKMFAHLRTNFNDHLRNDNLNSKDVVIAVSGKNTPDELIKKNTKDHKAVSVMGKNYTAENVTGQMINTNEHTLIANFKNTKGGLRATNINQWNELLTTVKNSTATNIIITIDGGSKDELGLINPIERTLLKETLEEMVQTGKRIFLITNLKHPTSSRFEEGVRYLNLNPNDKDLILLNVNRIADNIVYGIKTTR